MKQGEIQYRAFISYSHADKRVVDWLHRALEGYRIPSKLVGKRTVHGPVPARLGSLFRDRDELPAAGDLSTELKGALKRSLFLIVVCSPAAARSKWVNEEVRQFKLLHGRKRGDGTAHVLALIADGDPGDIEAGACFPEALKFHVLPDGTISDDPAEPIAADIRPGGDGKKLAKLKLVAGLTGLPLDALVQREAARRQRLSALVAGVSLALTVVMVVLTVLAIQGRQEAERQRAQADGLVEFMLTDLRQKLEPVGRLEVLDSVGQRALAYYETQNVAALDPNELGRRARALHLVGEVRDIRGDSKEALKAFREAERTTGELLAREPDNPERMFDHAQSLFWVGQTAWALENWPDAEAKFRGYADLADRMAATDPANPKWRREQGYAANSLGAFFLRTNRADEAVRQFRRYLQVEQAMALRAPEEVASQKEIGQAHAWLADAMAASGRFAEARAERHAELRVYSAILANDERDFDVRMFMARAQDALCDLHLLEGEVDIAVERCRVAGESFRSVLAGDPENRLAQEMAAAAKNRHSEALLLAGRLQEAEVINQTGIAVGLELVRADPARAPWKMALLQARSIAVEIDYAKRQTAAARAGLAQLQSDFASLSGADPAVGKGSALVSILALAAVERLAANDPASARKLATMAEAAAGTTDNARNAAILAALSARVPGYEASPRGPPSAYPADRRLALAGQG